MKPLITPILACLLILVVNSCTDSSVESSPTEGKGLYFFAYSSEPGGELKPDLPPVDSLSMFYINADGSGRREIPLSIKVKSIVKISENKKKMIVYSHDGLYSINTDGTNAIKLPIDNLAFYYNCLTADGQEFIYTVTEGPYKEMKSIYSIRTDGTNQRLIYTLKEGDIRELEISADGKHIIFSEYVAENVLTGLGLNYVKSDGTGKKTIFLWKPNMFGVVRYSPKGNKVAFSTANDTTGFALWIMNPDGTGLKTLFSHRYNNQHIRDWSADGSNLLVVHRHQESNWDIYEVATDGSSSKALANDPNVMENPLEWSKDGTMILFYGKDGLSTMNASGSNKRKINTGVTYLGNAFWSE